MFRYRVDVAHDLFDWIETTEELKEGDTIDLDRYGIWLVDMKTRMTDYDLIGVVKTGPAKKGKVL